MGTPLLYHFGQDLSSGLARKRAPSKTSPALRSQAMRKPCFTMMRTEFDGFRPEGDKPSEENIRAFLNFVTSSVDQWIEKPIDDWDEVLELTYGAVAFFRTYYCGEDPGQMPVMTPSDP